MFSNDFFKFRDIKTYGSTEWLANDTKKYRSVFDSQELTYVYCEVSLYNKKFDIDDWALSIDLKCFDEENNELFTIDYKKFCYQTLFIELILLN